MTAAAASRHAAEGISERQERLPWALRTLTSSAGAISVLALDHRDAMRNAFGRIGVPNPSEPTMLVTKSRIVSAIADHASALLLDPPAVGRCRRPDLGLLVPLESQGHKTLDGGRLTNLLRDCTPVHARSLGADCCKLLLYYRADHRATASRQLALAMRVSADCHRHGLALAVEPLIYRLEGEGERSYSRRFSDLIVAATGELAATGVDVLKLQFAGDTRACERVTEAASPLPWTLLGGAAVNGEAFAEQLRTACDAGACGFIAGRTIWGGALGLSASQQMSWLRDHARPLLERLTDIAGTHARRIP